MEKNVEVSFNDFIRASSPQELYNEDLIVFEINKPKENNPNSIPPIRINAVSVFVALHGEIAITIDYYTYLLKKGMTLNMNNLHIMENIHMSEDFYGFMILMSEDFVRRVTDKIQGLKKLVISSRQPHPVLNLEDDEVALIINTIARLRRNMKAYNHAFQDQLIENEVSNFLLELTNIAMQKMEKDPNFELGRKEGIASKFFKLLMTHCKEQHEVSFYATQLCMTSEHLSRIMKAVSGKTVNKWISDALLSESKILLRNRDINIQQVSEELNFADQSSFGKFFKKQTGKTPIEYKNEMILM